MPNFDGFMSPTDRSRPLTEDDLKRSPKNNRDGGYDSASDGSDMDEEDETMGMVLSRSALESMATSKEREEQLERANQELQRRVLEQDRILQRKISEHETELEDLENLLEETKSELSAKMREEKELRA